ncbi:rhomboid family intramembrane serine protease [Nocardioides insulae]|uniref:rhomboid family intramembrane serine protease n=1 Tax=Nocardioides insulae TaxID=394734 RepID=UPI00040AD510|nr:rhomboid family intramembrane serine protease [Nocardioides insulae]
MSTPAGAGPTPGAGVPTCYRHPGRESHIRCQRCGNSICPDCMTPAAVGFQCPDCVSQGRRDTRSGRTAYGGLMPTNATITSLVLIAINVGVWLAIRLTGGYSSRLFELLALSPSGTCTVDGGRYFAGATEAVCGSGAFSAGTWSPGVADGAWWELVTSMFVHVSITHLLFNCLAIYVLGPQLEHVLGRARFLAVYLLSGLAGSALVYWVGPETGATHGASGAIFGLVGAWVVLALKRRTELRSVFVWVAIMFAYTFLMPNISWQGHLGGFLGGLATTAVLVYAPRERRTAVQVGGLVAIGLVIAALVVARTATLT